MISCSRNAQLGHRGITVNTVQPGPVDTDMNPADGPFAEMLKSFMALKALWPGTRDCRLFQGASLTIDGGFSV
jgi:3-oxoacyl-[acyl-carrier protein] reductase